MRNEKSKILLNLLEALDSYLLQQGYRRKNLTYGKRTDHYWLVINWQVSTDKLPGKIKFTVNLGVHDLRLAEMYEDPVKACPDVWMCHLRERIGFVMPERIDKWWVIDELAPISADLVEEFLNITKDVAVPYLNKFKERNDLLDLWKSGISPGQTDKQRIRLVQDLEKTPSR